MDWDVKPYQSLVFMGVELKPAFYCFGGKKREVYFICTFLLFCISLKTNVFFLMFLFLM